MALDPIMKINAKEFEKIDLVLVLVEIAGLQIVDVGEGLKWVVCCEELVEYLNDSGYSKSMSVESFMDILDDWIEE